MGFFRLALNRDKLILRLIVFSIFLKLTISPWATGDFESDWGHALSYCCDGLLLLTVLAYSSAVSAQYQYIYISFCATAISYAVATFAYTELPATAFLNTHLKVYLPILVFTTLHSIAIKSPAYFMTWSRKIAIYITFLIVLGLIFLPASGNRGASWWPSYFGGLHTSAYVALMIAFMVYGLNRSEFLYAKASAVWFISLAFIVYFGWGVRTATLALLVFLLALFINRLQIGSRQIYLVLLPLSIALIFIGYAFISTDLIDSFSSGRISMYKEKYDQLMRNDFLQWLIGNGKGSDLIETDIWWWAAKGAHSDLITFLVEGGIFYLGVFIAIIIKLIKQERNPEFSFILISAILTSTFSNGIFVRPAAAYLMAFALVTIIITAKIRYENGNE